METAGTLDQLFYKADQHNVATMIMAGASILAPAKPGGRLNARVITDHIAARLEQIPLLRQTLVQDPLRLGRLQKVEDPDFNVRDHVATASLPKPGGYAELTRFIGEFSSEPLAPGLLWRWLVVDGLEGGRLAVLCKLHHALADGVGAGQVLGSMYDSQPARPEKPKQQQREVSDQPDNYTLLRNAVLENTRRTFVSTPRFFLKNTLPILSAAGGGVMELLRSSEKRRELLDQPQPQSTSLSISESSGERSIAYRTLSLPEVKKLARYYGCKVNDIGLLLFSFALQHYFDAIGEKIDFDLWCGAPVSTRTENSQAGNQLSVMRVCLHNTIADAVERLEAIRSDTAHNKLKLRPQEPLLDMGEVGELVYPLAMEGLLYLMGKLNLFGRAANSYTVFNALLSNVPGPPETLYIANAVMVETIPLIPVVDVMAMSGGITSVSDSITLGFHCAADAVPDAELFLGGIDLAMQELRSAASLD